MLKQQHPVYDHDCEDCKFLGTMTIEGVLYDFYSCDTGFYLTRVARYSSKGSDYLTLPHFLGSNPEIEPFKTFFSKKR